MVRSGRKWAFVRNLSTSGTRENQKMESFCTEAVFIFSSFVHIYILELLILPGIVIEGAGPLAHGPVGRLGDGDGLTLVLLRQRQLTGRLGVRGQVLSPGHAVGFAVRMGHRLREKVDPRNIGHAFFLTCNSSRRRSMPGPGRRRRERCLHR